MTLPLAQMPLRIARPSRDLHAAERFWGEGVGLEVLSRVEAANFAEHDLLMMGGAEAGWHLELVCDPALLSEHPPSAEDLLVLYLDAEVDEVWLDRIVAAGGQHVEARNPYWAKWGTTILDPDGYRLVLSTRGWGQDS